MVPGTIETRSRTQSKVSVSFPSAVAPAVGCVQSISADMGRPLCLPISGGGESTRRSTATGEAQIGWVVLSDLNGGLPDDDAFLRWQVHGIVGVDVERVVERIHVAQGLHTAHRRRCVHIDGDQELGVLVGRFLAPG